MNYSTISLPDFVSNTEIKWAKDVMTIPMSADALFQRGVWADGTGNEKKYSEIDLQQYASEKDEGDQAKIAKSQQGYTKTTNPITFSDQVSITYEMRKYNKYQEITARLTNLSSLNVNRMDLDLAHRITFGAATTYTTRDGKSRDITIGDGLALFSTAHTLRASSDTYRNVQAANPRLSRGAMEGMERLCVEETLDQFGNKMTSTFDILFTTDDPNTVNTARELLQSTASVSAPNAGVTNVYKAKYRHVIISRIATDANGGVDSDKRYYWGLASSSAGVNSAYFDVAEMPTLEAPTYGDGINNSTQDWTFTALSAYSICIVGARWIKLSKGDGTA